jgi:hypothetical protein
LAFGFLTNEIVDAADFGWALFHEFRDSCDFAIDPVDFSDNLSAIIDVGEFAHGSDEVEFVTTIFVEENEVLVKGTFELFARQFLTTHPDVGAFIELRLILVANAFQAVFATGVSIVPGCVKFF